MSVQGGNRQMSWGSDAVAETLRQLAIPYVALVPGASFRGLHDSLVNYLGNDTPQMIVCLHEEHAVAIAEGYARVTETPMAVALHSNVGLMHAAMPIFNAWCDRTPVLILGATGPIDADQRRPWIDWIHTAQDQGALVRNFVKWDDQPTSPKASIESVLRAYQIADTRPKGPTYVCLDAGMQEAALSEPVVVPDVVRFRAGRPPSANDEDIDAALSILGNAKSPVVLMGRVSRSADQWNTRIRLVEALGAVVFTTLHRPPAFPSTHPLHVLPPCAERPTPEETAIIRAADAIISFDWIDLAGYLRGCLSSSQTQAPIDATVIQCSLDSYLHNGWSMDHQALAAIDLNILADPDQVIAQLAERLASDRAGSGHVGPPAAIKHWTETAATDETGDSDAMSLAALAHTVAEFARARDVTLARIPIGWPGTACRFEHPLDYLGKDGGGTVGTGPGHTIGSALALKGSGRLVVGVVGDGDFLMGVNALWTAAHLELPVILIIANNGGYYNDVRHQERVAAERGRPIENKWIGQKLSQPTPDIVALARAQGFDGEGPVTTRIDLVAALDRAEACFLSGGQYVIDVRVGGY